MNATSQAGLKTDTWYCSNFREQIKHDAEAKHSQQFDVGIDDTGLNTGGGQCGDSTRQMKMVHKSEAFSAMLHRNHMIKLIIAFC